MTAAAAPTRTRLAAATSIGRRHRLAPTTCAPGCSARRARTKASPSSTSGAEPAVDLLRTLPRSAERCGLAHGDLNPGNILRQTHSPSTAADAPTEWLAIDPKPVHGDLAWDPWPLLTQVGDWLTVVPSAADLAARTRLVAEATGLDAARIASWCTARSVASGLWAGDRGWWSGFRGADGDLKRAEAWARAADLLAR